LIGAKLDPRLPLRLRTRKSLAFQVVSAALQVRAKLLFHLPLDARPVDEVGIEVRVGDNAEEVGDEVFAHVEEVTMRIGANFVPIKHEGVIYIRPPVG